MVKLERISGYDSSVNKESSRGYLPPSVLEVFHVRKGNASKRYWRCFHWRDRAAAVCCVVRVVERALVSCKPRRKAHHEELRPDSSRTRAQEVEVSALTVLALALIRIFRRVQGKREEKENPGGGGGRGRGLAGCAGLRCAGILRDTDSFRIKNIPSN